MLTCVAPTLAVAHDLIGKVLVHVSAGRPTSGRIVEVEAYVGESDPACHAATGFTRRNAPLYGVPGRSYVYLNYGVHYLFNAVTESEGAPAAVLIRALEPLVGVDLMHRRRASGARPVPTPHLCRGPGNLTRALGISLAQNRVDLTGERLFIVDPQRRTAEVQWSRRIGIRVGADRPWRCYATDSPCVSGSLRPGL